MEIIREGISRKSASSSTTQVRSTITGMILDVPIKVGNSVIQSNTFNDGTTIASVADMNNMIFRGKVDETEVGRIHEGMPIKLTVGALDSRTFDATLEYVARKEWKKTVPSCSRSKRPFRCRKMPLSVPVTVPMPRSC